MTFDVASFLIGFVTFPCLAWITYVIFTVIEARQKEAELWNRVQSAPSPSQEYRRRMAAISVGQETYDDPGSIVLRPASPPPKAS